MRLSLAPDLGTSRRLALTALAVTLVAAISLAFRDHANLARGLGDTDDATRLVLMRGLLSGQGWYDQLVTRYQPPIGTYMHWSRLLDGGLAALDSLFRLVLSPAGAETATRFTWPLLWLFPAVLAALGMAKRLDQGASGVPVVLICAIMLMIDLQLYAQFRPGRVDHHDAQMVFCLLALTGAVQRGPRIWGAVLAGAATGLGLAIGLEALAFDAAMGMSFALRFAVDPNQRRSVQAYGTTLALATLAAYGLQTPPGRWGVVACDALAANSAAALAIAGAGLTLAASLTGRKGWIARTAALAGVGALTLCVYLGFDPHCSAGPFADVDPRIKPIWLNHVNEMRPWSRVLKREPADAISFAVPWVVGLIAWAGLGFKRERRADPAWRLIGACLIMAVVIAAGGIRMTGYAEWFAIPPLAAAVAELVARLRKPGWLAPVTAGAVANPMALASLVLVLTGHAAWQQQKKPKGPPSPPDHCFDTAAYRELAAIGPPGLVLSEVDLGPFVLAHTRHSAMSAPYHRMSWGILQARSVLAAPADTAAADAAHRLGVGYVLECRVHAGHADRDALSKASLQKRLDAGKPPAWLEPLSSPRAPLQAYRVMPSAPFLPREAGERDRRTAVDGVRAAPPSNLARLQRRPPRLASFPTPIAQEKG